MKRVNASLPQSLSDRTIIVLFLKKYINQKIVHIIQLLHYKARKYFIDILWWTSVTLFRKILNSTPVDLFIEISRLQLRKGSHFY